MGIEDAIGDQAGHGDDLPAGGVAEDLVEAFEIGYAVGGDFELGQAIEKRIDDAARQQVPLAVVQSAPKGVLGRGVSVPPLINDVIVRAAGRCRR